MMGTESHEKSSVYPNIRKRPSFPLRLLFVAKLFTWRVLPSENQSFPCDRRRIYLQRAPPEVVRREVLKAYISSPLPKPTRGVAGKNDANAKLNVWADNDEFDLAVKVTESA